MKKFRFRFETVEKVRKTREDEALRALGEAQGILAKARACCTECDVVSSAVDLRLALARMTNSSSAQLNGFLCWPRMSPSFGERCVIPYLIATFLRWVRRYAASKLP